jgi:hypothetical protein
VEGSGIGQRLLQDPGGDHGDAATHPQSVALCRCLLHRTVDTETTQESPTTELVVATPPYPVIWTARGDAGGAPPRLSPHSVAAQSDRAATLTV